MEQGRSEALIRDLESCLLDVAIVTRPAGQPPGLDETHSFNDVFVAIAPSAQTSEVPSGNWNDWPILGINRATETGKILTQWQTKRLGAPLHPMMEFDGFDLIIHSVAQGMGAALVPRRSLANFARKKQITRLPIDSPPSRTLCALARKELNRPAITQAFIDNILF